MSGNQTDEARETVREALSHFSLQIAHGSKEDVAKAVDNLTDVLMLLIKPDPIDDRE